MRHEFTTSQFNHAATDYYHLLNKGYPEKRTRLLVADRYQLNKTQRTVLYRGIFPRTVNRQRKLKQLDESDVRNHALSIDFLNLVYLVMNYLYGRNLFIATDGFLRDDGENYSHYSSVSFFLKTLDLILSACTVIKPAEVEIVIEPQNIPQSLLSYSEPLYLSKALSTCETTVYVRTTEAAHRHLKNCTDSIIVSADSRIIDHNDTGAFDLGHFILDYSYKARLLDMTQILRHSDSSWPKIEN
ncbi:MAG: DUF434 domain-containing protein [Spirochaetaceae bacterium]|nr:DUF434 domain-containing protein [Spirochaetaceae bacterium]MCF7951577.1 DUF434 domain-containing protein [Spirochaetaceae bacterium]